jgi:hypothetical protein
MPAPDLRPLFTGDTAAKVHRGLAMTLAPTQSSLVLDHDALSLLRDGLGGYDMEIRWMAHLDDSNTLRLWRSWTGLQIYEATVVLDQSQTSGAILALKVEQDKEHYRGSMAEEPTQFEEILASTLDTLRHFRAGHTPYGPAEGAGPVPPPWPEPDPGLS